jgi:hypothetical protein
LKILFEYTPYDPNKELFPIHASFTNISSGEISDFIFQAAVPKVRVIFLDFKNFFLHFFFFSELQITNATTFFELDGSESIYNSGIEHNFGI